MQTALAGLYEWSTYYVCSVPVYFSSFMRNGQTESTFPYLQPQSLWFNLSEGLVCIALPYLVPLDQENGTTTFQEKMGCFLCLECEFSPSMNDRYPAGSSWHEPWVCGKGISLGKQDLWK